jgi:hypothetical protein
MEYLLNARAGKSIQVWAGKREFSCRLVMLRRHTRTEVCTHKSLFLEIVAIL